MDLEIIQTEDGSSSIYVNDLKETYHSKYGAIAESKHVFIQAGLKQLPKSNNYINLLEIGFGTGLNALLTNLYCIEHKIKTDYLGLEPFPVLEKVYTKLNYPEKLNISSESFLQMHQSLWNKEFELNQFFTFKKLKQKFEDTELPDNHFNLVYFDAFAPGIQEELWTSDVFNKIRQSMKRNGILVTYSAKGSVRRNLQNNGFNVERIPGPVGKREMLRATAV